VRLDLHEPHRRGRGLCTPAHLDIELVGDGDGAELVPMSRGSADPVIA
jgi:hypothetical protein